MSSNPDGVLRAITEDGAFRVITIRSTETVRGAIAAQRATGANATLFGDLVTGAVLVRESMAPDLRVQCILQGADRRGRIVADAHPDGSSRGLLQLATGATDIVLGDKALLQVARTLHNGGIQQGVVPVPSEGGISAAVMQYMQLSEQVVSMCAVGCLVDAGEVVAAGGYLVQLLPEVLDQKGPLMVMTERLKDFESIVPLLAKGQAAPDTLLAELLFGMPHAIVGESTLRFGCQCSPERVALALATLPKADTQELFDRHEPIELTCDYCGRAYVFPPEQLRGLLDQN